MALAQQVRKDFEQIEVEVLQATVIHVGDG
jgi:hypothetical protein